MAGVKGPTLTSPRNTWLILAPTIKKTNPRSLGSLQKLKWCPFYVKYAWLLRRPTGGPAGWLASGPAINQPVSAPHHSRSSPFIMFYCILFYSIFVLIFISFRLFL